MLAAALGSGILNPALWAAVAALVLLARRSPHRAPGWLTRLAVGGLGVAAAVTLAGGLYRSYTVPRDVMQDIIAAREYLAGRPMHPDHMNQLMRQALAEEGPRRSLFGWWPAVAEQERRQLDQTLNEHWVQAHPPLMTLLAVPFVASFGVLGTQVAFSLLAAAGLAATLWLIRRELWPDARGWVPAAVALAVLGWAPVVAVFRLQQPGLLLVGLLVAAWAWLRHRREAPAGAAVVAAAGLKLAPGLLAFPLLARHPRAAAALLVTAAVLAAGLLAAVPVSDLWGYHVTASGVVDEYATYPTMISLLGVFARWGRAVGLPFPAAEAVWLVALTAVVGFWGNALVRRPRGTDPAAETDFEFAIGMALVPLLSPIAWDHYQVFLLLPVAVLARHLPGEAADRPRRVLFGVLLVALAIPDALFLWAFEHARGPVVAVRVLILEPFRAFAGAGLAYWLAREWLREPAAAPVPESACPAIPS